MSVNELFEKRVKVMDAHARGETSWVNAREPRNSTAVDRQNETLKGERKTFGEVPQTLKEVERKCLENILLEAFAWDD